MVSINVAQLLKAQTGETRSFDYCSDPGAFAGELDLATPITGQVQLLRTARGILVTCHHWARVHLSCSRCLADVTAAVEGRFQEEVFPSLSLRTGEFVPETEETAGRRIDEHNELNLDELIREDVLVNLPLRVLCHETCKGLCATCGLDRNTGECRCAANNEREQAQLGRLGEALRREIQRGTEGV